MGTNLQKKTFVVAGGSKGIGIELVRQLSRAGGEVHTFSRTTGELSEEQKQLHHSIDFENDEFDSSLLPEKIHGAAYCPGTINLRSFRGLKLEDFRHDFEVNLIGAVKFLKACLPALKKTSEGQPSSVVLFSTVAVSTGLSMHSSVAACKGAVEGLARSLAAEWAPQVRVNCLAPALTETPLSANFFSTDEKRAAMAAKYPLGRTGLPEDVAAMARFLLSPDSNWITGQVIGVDGGMSKLSV